MTTEYQISSSTVRTKRSHPDLFDAIKAFERKCKRKGVPKPRNYPPLTSGDVNETINIDDGFILRYQGPRDGHGWVYVEATYRYVTAS